MPHRLPCAALLALDLPSAALAQPAAADARALCSDYRDVQRQLAAGYGEAPVP